MTKEKYNVKSIKFLNYSINIIDLVSRGSNPLHIHIRNVKGRGTSRYR